MKLKKGEKIWTKVEINDNELREELVTNSEEVLKRIEREINAADLNTIIGSKTDTTILTVIGTLKNLLTTNLERLVTIYCLREFMLRKKKVIQEVAIITLGKDETKKYSNEFALVCVLHSQNPMNIMDIYLKYQVGNRSFDTYSLHSEKSSRPKTNFEEMNEDEINKILDRMDKDTSGGKSFCWHIVNETDITEMYIRTEADKQTLLKMLKDNVPAVLAKSTILRFHKKGRTVDLWSKNDSGARMILNHIAKTQFDKGASYVPISYENSSDKVDQFLHNLTRRLDGKVQLLKIERTNSPLEGAPTILLESSLSIVPAIQDLNHLGRDIITDSALHMKSIKLGFEEREVTLSFKRTDSGILLIPPYHRGSNDFLIKLDDYIKAKYDIRISLGTK